jgi:phage tail sheath protein FI
MPITPTFPGIYIEEIPSSTHSITAAPTSITVFAGYTHPFKTNPANWGKAVEIFSFTEYEREFGGLYTSGVIESHVAYAVNQFFLNGGADAFVVALQPSFHTTTGVNKGVVPPATLQVGSILFTGLEPTGPFDLIPMTVTILPSGGGADITINYGSRSETFRKVTLTRGDPKFIEKSINGVSQLVTVSPTFNPPFVAQSNAVLTQNVPVAIGSVALTAIQPTDPVAAALKMTATIGNLQSNGTIADLTVTYGANPPTTLAGVNLIAGDPNFIETRVAADATVSTQITVSPAYQAPFQGVNQVTLGYPNADPHQPLWTTFSENDFFDVFQQDSSLDKVSIFNLLAIPGVADNSVWSEALAFCERKQAFVILDPLPQDSSDGDGSLNLPLMGDDIQGSIVPKSTNGALYFPYLQSGDPLTGNTLELPPSGFVAGIYARTDVNRGVWKAPAGLETIVNNTTGVVERGQMTDLRQGTLNPLGVNCLRDFPGVGTVVFGARTLVTENPALEQWRYVPVRRIALFLEQTLYRNLGWVVFEPNDEPLWVAIKNTIESFMLSLFHQGAFQGDTPSQAFQVKCDSSTTTQQDIDNGIVNIIVAFAPLKPAEFVIIKIAQLAGQTQS